MSPAALEPAQKRHRTQRTGPWRTTLLFVLFALLVPAGQTTPVVGQIAKASYRAGDRVDDHIGYRWGPAKVLQTGGNPNKGYPYHVRYGAQVGGQPAHMWLRAEWVRPARESGTGAAASGPRLGRYTILSYGNPSNPVRLGYIDLVSGGAYRFYSAGNRLLGKGKYSVVNGSVQWQSGLLQEQGWGGDFTVERGGKTHKIRLKGATIAVNSTN